MAFFPAVRLELHIVSHTFEFETTRSTLNIEKKAAALDIAIRPPKLTVDQTLPREEAGFRSMLSFARYWADQAREDIKAAIEETASAGDRLQKIELPQSGLVELAEQALYHDPPEVNIQAIPVHPPEIRAELNPPQIRFTPGNLQVDFQPAVIKSYYSPGKIQGQLVVKSNLNVNV